MRYSVTHHHPLASNKTPLTKACHTFLFCIARCRSWVAISVSLDIISGKVNFLDFTRWYLELQRRRRDLGSPLALLQCPEKISLHCVSLTETGDSCPYIMVTLVGQWIFWTRRRRLVYVPSSLCCCLSVRVHVSAPYSKIGSITAVNSFIFRLLSMFERHTLSWALQACQASAFLVLKFL